MKLNKVFSGLILILFLVIANVSSLFALTKDKEAVKAHNKNIEYKALRFDVMDESMRPLIDELGNPKKDENGNVIADPNDINPIDTLYRIIIDPFERANEWTCAIPNDSGVIKVRQLYGSPKPLVNAEVSIKTPWPRYKGPDGKYNDYYFEDQINPGFEKPAASDEAVKIQNVHILGVKVSFFRRGYHWFGIYPPEPVSLDGVVKSFSVWVSGRNKKHDLYVLVRDIYGEKKLIHVAKLDYLGWKHLQCQVPTNIKQSDYSKFNKRGLIFEGFVVKCDLEDTWGDYFMYFDNLTADLSRFWEESRDEYDPLDTW